MIKTNKYKLILPVIGLMTLVIAFGILIVAYNYNQLIKLENLKAKVIYSTIASKSIIAIQKERGYSSGYVSSKRPKFLSLLTKAKKITDKEIGKIITFLDNHKDVYYKKEKEKLLLIQKNIAKVREEVLQESINLDGLLQKYTSYNFELIDVVVSTIKESEDSEITQNLIAYLNLFHLMENAGIERALGLAILLDRKMNTERLVDFSNAINLQKQRKTMFLKFASGYVRKQVKMYYEKDLIATIENEERKIYSHQFTTKPQTFFDYISEKISISSQINNKVRDETIDYINSKSQHSRYVFMGVVGVMFFSFVGFIFLVSSLMRLVRDEMKLRTITEKYIISSTTDRRGIITDVSEAFCAISGYSKEELIGKPHSIVRHPDMPKSAFDEMWSTIQQGKAWQGKVKNRKKDGGFYIVYANIEPIFNNAGKIVSYISIRLDMTENELLLEKIQEEESKNKMQEELLQQQYRMAQMGEMLSMIAHQWRQPLSAITAAAGTISLKGQTDSLDAETSLKLSGRIKDFSRHLSSTIDDFRNFFKPDKKKSITDFSKIVESILLITESSLSSKGIKVIKNINSVQSVYTHENEVKQVLLNLIKNAEDAIVENKIKDPIITITVDKNILTVADNAGGIAEDLMEKIFDPYFSTKNKKDGTGLGLYMSKIIIEDHCDGILEVQNDNQGALFRITLGDRDE